MQFNGPVFATHLHPEDIWIGNPSNRCSLVEYVAGDPTIVGLLGGVVADPFNFGWEDTPRCIITLGTPMVKTYQWLPYP